MDKHTHSRYWAHLIEPTMYSNKQRRLQFATASNTLTTLAHAVLDEETGQLLNYRQLLQHPRHREVWTTSSANEFGQLAQGVGTRIKGTNTIHFIPKTSVPQDRFHDVTYGKFVCDYCPQKDSPYRTWLTVGGNKVNYPAKLELPPLNCYWGRSCSTV